MAEPSPPGDVDPAAPEYVENPVTGERFLFHTSPEDPATDPLAFDLWATPAMEPLAEHVHPRQVERLTVRDGTITVRMEGATETVHEGSALRIPTDTPHTWWVGGDREVHLTVRFEPGYRTEAFLRDLATLARRGTVRPDGAPTVLAVAALYDAYGFELLHLANPPLPVQKAVCLLLAPVARLLGYSVNPVPDATE